MGTEFTTLNLELKSFYFTALTMVAPPDSAFLFQKLLLFHFLVKFSIKPPSRGCKPNKICHGRRLTIPTLNTQIHGADQQSLAKNWLLLKPHILNCVTVSGGVQTLKRLIPTTGKCKNKRNHSILFEGKKIKTNPHHCLD